MTFLTDKFNILIAAILLLIFVTSPLYSYTIFDQRTKALISQAKAGDKRAQYKLGLAYLRGTTVKYNRYRARNWLRKSAAQNYYKAWYTLGEMHFTSKYRMRNYRVAFRWFMKAAKNNHGQSQYYIALHYFTGKGVARKNYSALIWAARAKKNGVVEAADLLSAIQLKISRVSSQTKLRAVRKAKAREIAKVKARVRTRKVARAKVRAKIRARAAARMRARSKANKIAKTKSAAKAKTLALAKTRIRELAQAESAAKEQLRKLALIKARELKELANKPEFDPMNITDVRKLLYSSTWRQGGAPSDYIPSVSSECVEVESSIQCTSRRIRTKFDEYTVHFRIMSTITDFRAKGEFTIRYRKNYLLVLRDNPKSEKKIPELGLVTKSSQLYCRIVDKSQIQCVKPDNSKFIITAGLPIANESVTSAGN